jgi:hypothetical protein
MERERALFDELRRIGHQLGESDQGGAGEELADVVDADAASLRTGLWNADEPLLSAARPRSRRD